MLDGASKHIAPYRDYCGVEDAIDLRAVLGPLLDLVEVADVRNQRVVGFFVGPVVHRARLTAAAASAAPAASRNERRRDRLRPWPIYPSPCAVRVRPRHRRRRVADAEAFGGLLDDLGRRQAARSHVSPLVPHRRQRGDSRNKRYHGRGQRRPDVTRICASLEVRRLSSSCCKKSEAVRHREGR